VAPAVNHATPMIVVDSGNLLAAYELRTASSAARSELKGPFLIGDLCSEFGITPRTLRFYEASGLLLPRRRGQRRFYDRRDREKLYLILRLREAGFSLKDIASFFAYGCVWNDASLVAIPQQVATAKLHEIQDRIDRLSQAAAFLRGILKQRSNGKRLSTSGIGR
jgi:DNA-binding transcriptional MerR regulator